MACLAAKVQDEDGLVANRKQLCIQTAPGPIRIFSRTMGASRLRASLFEMSLPLNACLIVVGGQVSGGDSPHSHSVAGLPRPAPMVAWQKHRNHGRHFGGRLVLIMAMLHNRRPLKDPESRRHVLGEGRRTSKVLCGASASLMSAILNKCSSARGYREFGRVCTMTR